MYKLDVCTPLVSPTSYTITVVSVFWFEEWIPGRGQCQYFCC